MAESFNYFVVTPEGAVHGYGSNDQPTELAHPGFAKGVSTDGIYLWVISTEADESTGGNLLKVRILGESNWTTIQCGAPGAAQLCASGGGRCIYVAENGELWQVNAAQDKLNFLVPQDLKLLQISSNMDTEQPYYWGLFESPESDASLLQHSTDLKSWTSPSGAEQGIEEISVGAPGFAPGGNPCWFVNEANQVIVMEPGGGPSPISDPGFALSISASGNDVIYVVSTEADEQTGGNLVKSWNGSWASTNVPAIAVAGVYSKG